MIGYVERDRALYPEIEPFETGFLKTSDGVHELYFERCGNPNGLPVVVLHGGPGAGCSPGMRRFFDPDRYHMVLFDQRGAGRSRPHASLEANTTHHLVQDIEQLRARLKIDKWLVFGGSWGSTLSLVYAETHPEVVLGLVLRGIFLCRPQEIQWFYQEGASRLFPELFREYKSVIPQSEQKDLVTAFYRRLTSDDPAIRLRAAKAWTLWEGQTSYLVPDKDKLKDFEEDEFALAFARIESHYFYNQIFLSEEEQILPQAHRLNRIPTKIVHGRYDIVCPIENAFDLYEKLDHCDFLIAQNSGHSANEAEIRSALVQFTDQFAQS